VKEYLAKILRRETLSEGEAHGAMTMVMDGEATPAQIGALLSALAVRGETEDEVVGFARAMRGRARSLRSEGVVDTCGTGGDGAGTFNISTLASLVVASCGVPVAKHGNRSASGSCGSADVLEALGLRIEAPPETVQRSLDEAGWAFLFAPGFHASTRHAAGPRKELGVRTAFNLLGPLTNPALPEAQIVGVARSDLTLFMARCLQRLGVRRAWVVHGSGIDEISLTGETTVTSFDGGGMKTWSLTPEEAGLPRAEVEALRGGDARTNAAIALGILAGQRGPRRDIVLLNAGAMLFVSGKASSLVDGVRLAGEAIDEGRSAGLLHKVTEISRS